MFLSGQQCQTIVVNAQLTSNHPARAAGPCRRFICHRSSRIGTPVSWGTARRRRAPPRRAPGAGVAVAKARQALRLVRGRVSGKLPEAHGPEAGVHVREEDRPPAGCSSGRSAQLRLPRRCRTCRSRRSGRVGRRGSSRSGTGTARRASGPAGCRPFPRRRRRPPPPGRSSSRSTRYRPLRRRHESNAPGCRARSSRPAGEMRDRQGHRPVRGTPVDHDVLHDGRPSRPAPRHGRPPRCRRRTAPRRSGRATPPVAAGW